MVLVLPVLGPFLSCDPGLMSSKVEGLSSVEAPPAPPPTDHPPPISPISHFPHRAMLNSHSAQPLLHRFTCSSLDQWTQSPLVMISFAVRPDPLETQIPWTPRYLLRSNRCVRSPVLIAPGLVEDTDRSFSSSDLLFSSLKVPQRHFQATLVPAFASDVFLHFRR